MPVSRSTSQRCSVTSPRFDSASLRPSAISALEIVINAEIAEGRRERRAMVQNAVSQRLRGRGSWVRGSGWAARQGSARALPDRRNETSLRATNLLTAVLEEPHSMESAFLQTIAPHRLLQPS